MLLVGTNAVLAASQRFLFWPANQTCKRVGLQVALDHSKKDAAKMQGWVAVTRL